MKKKKSLKKLKEKAWKMFSQFIRKNAANKDGYARCITCTDEKKAWRPWKQLQAGHFVPGRGNSILFAEHNVHPQCYVCNCILGGNWTEYYKFMKQTYGMEVIDHLISLKNKTKIMTIQDYEDLIELYKNYEN